MYSKVINFVLDKFSLLTNILVFLDPNKVFVSLTPISIGLGIGIGIIGSTLALRKHVRNV